MTIPDAPARLSRAGILAFAAVVSAAACSSPQPAPVAPPPAQPEPPPAPVEPPPAVLLEVDAGAPEMIDAGAPEAIDAGLVVVDSGPPPS